jgi:hypothetical protein
MGSSRIDAHWVCGTDAGDGCGKLTLRQLLLIVKIV